MLKEKAVNWEGKEPEGTVVGREVGLNVEIRRWVRLVGKLESVGMQLKITRKGRSRYDGVQEKRVEWELERLSDARRDVALV